MVFAIPDKNSIRMNDVYSLNFDLASTFSSLIKGKQGPLYSQFEKAFLGGNLKDKLNFQGKTIQMLRGIPTESESPEIAVIIKDAEAACQKINEIYSVFGGASPFEIQQLVHKVLGICEDTSVSQELKNECFSILKESGFLITKHDNLEQIIYNPGDEAERFLTDHTEVQTLLFGCGAMIDTNCHSCLSRYNDPVELHLKGLKLDIDASSAPDVIADMHDIRFWKAIPNGKFEKIIDHTLGNFLFTSTSSKQTLEQIFRSLKPGGYLEFKEDLEEGHKVLLKSTGFEVAGEYVKIAAKPNE